MQVTNKIKNKTKPIYKIKTSTFIKPVATSYQVPKLWKINIIIY